MNSTKFVGLDISTRKTGVAYLENGNLKDYKLLDNSNIKDTNERIRQMGNDIISILNEYNPSIIYVEDSWNAANVETTKKLTLLMGISYAWAIQHNSEWNSILPSQWRKYCGINQSKKKRVELKQESIDYVKQRYNIDVNDDVADAIALSDGIVNYYENLEDNDELFS